MVRSGERSILATQKQFHLETLFSYGWITYCNLNIIMDKHRVIQEYTVNCVSIEKLKKSSFILWHNELPYLCSENLTHFPEMFWQSTFPDLPLPSLLTCNCRDFSPLLGTSLLWSTARCSPALPKQWICLWHWVELAFGKREFSAHIAAENLDWLK